MHQFTDSPQLSQYYATAAKATAPLEIVPGSAEWASWELYFNAVYGRKPAAMSLRELNMTKAFCVPAQWPEWFDASFAMGEPVMGKGIPWSEDAAIRHLAGKRMTNDAIEQGWIPALVDFVRREHRTPNAAEMNTMADDADEFSQRISDMRSGAFEAGALHNLKDLGEVILRRRFLLAKRIADYRDGMKSVAPTRYAAE